MRRVYIDRIYDLDISIPGQFACRSRANFRIVYRYNIGHIPNVFTSSIMDDGNDW